MRYSVTNAETHHATAATCVLPQHVGGDQYRVPEFESMSVSVPVEPRDPLPAMQLTLVIPRRVGLPQP